MDLNNIVLYAKGWYKKRDNAKWMDLAHCIYHDLNILCYSKQDVYRIVCHQYDKHFITLQKYNNITPSWLLGKVYDEVDYSEKFLSKKISVVDATINVYLDLLAYSPIEMFERVLKPTEKVLPLDMFPAFIDTYGDKCWHPAEMHSDTIARIDDLFKDGQAQEVDKYWSYVDIESSLRKKHYEDVRLPLDYDFDCDVITVNGKEINSRFNNFIYKNRMIDMGAYNGIWDVPIDKEFKVSIKHMKDGWDGYYEVRKIEAV